MIALAAAVAEPQRGWGGPLAIMIAFAGVGLLHVVMERRKNISPTPPEAGVHRVNMQVSEVSDTDGTSLDPVVDDWWGRIVTLPDSSRVRRFRQIWRTGSAELPAGELDGDLDRDLDLDDDPEPENLDGLVRDHLGRLGYADLVRAGMSRWRVSESTMKRRIANAKKALSD